MRNPSIMLPLSKLLLLPIFAWQFLRGNIQNAVALLILLGIIGFVQGFFTRRLPTSCYGSRLLDAAADKLTQAFAAILLAFRYPVYWWVFVVVMGKELVSLALGIYQIMHDIRSDKTMWAEKICNLTLYLAMTPLMLHLDRPPWLPIVSQVLLVASAAVSALCYLPGVVFSIRRLHQERMRKLGRQKKKGIKPYGVFAIGVLPLSTIVFASKGDPLTVNLSIIGNQPGHRVWFILWGALCAVCFVSLFMKTFHEARYEGKIERCLMIAAGVSFIACVLTPFLPEKYPIAAKWHNVMAVSASTLIVLVSLLLSRYLRRVDRHLYHTAMLQWGIITCVCIGLIIATGISGLFEVVLIISVSLHTYHILAQLTRAPARR